MRLSTIEFQPTQRPDGRRVELFTRVFLVRHLDGQAAIGWSPGWAVDQEECEDDEGRPAELRLVSGLRDEAAVRQWLRDEVTGRNTGA